MSQQPPPHVKPGNALFIQFPVFVKGVLTDLPAGATVMLHFFDGTTQGPTPPVRDSLGTYHIDMLCPLGTGAGPAWCRVTASGVPVDSNLLAEQMFIVDLLAF